MKKILPILVTLLTGCLPVTYPPEQTPLVKCILVGDKLCKYDLGNEVCYFSTFEGGFLSCVPKTKPRAERGQ